ncbi:uncharacterized protein MCYG_07809 [Microsporum canis CBS 113480]|uniref:Uncharacterized protein n=1 Tax=Arthroderma otae (strain ATCC MYA-4605 / CBS 113480) TaxID=554155 RepID=C5FXF0_ARTOC|nr:uncharacterized protein MCYG_07809 [Microsporum canis CBS 113480]EEQ34990.1 predicted protein [Microsporum canis CBS 113480]
MTVHSCFLPHTFFPRDQLPQCDLAGVSFYLFTLAAFLAYTKRRTIGCTGYIIHLPRLRHQFLYRPVEEERRRTDSRIILRPSHRQGPATVRILAGSALDFLECDRARVGILVCCDILHCRARGKNWKKANHVHTSKYLRENLTRRLSGRRPLKREWGEEEW